MLSGRAGRAGFSFYFEAPLGTLKIDRSAPNPPWVDFSFEASLQAKAIDWLLVSEPGFLVRKTKSLKKTVFKSFRGLRTVPGS